MWAGHDEIGDLIRQLSMADLFVLPTIRWRRQPDTRSASSVMFMVSSTLIICRKRLRQSPLSLKWLPVNQGLNTGSLNRARFFPSTAEKRRHALHDAR